MITEAERKQIEKDRHRPHNYVDQIDNHHTRQMVGFRTQLTAEQRAEAEAWRAMVSAAYKQWNEFRANVGKAADAENWDEANYWYRMADNAYWIWTEFDLLARTMV